MPPRKPTIRISPRIPKIKEMEINEGLTPANVREIEFVSKTESVIQNSTK
jgi:hypothetical protein